MKTRLFRSNATLTSYEISKALRAVRSQLQKEEHQALRREVEKYSNLMVEGTPGKFVRAEALEVLKRAQEAVR
jgi:allophanate hydrolase subunit 1